MKKKFLNLLVLILITVCAVALVACKNKDNYNTSGSAVVTLNFDQKYSNLAINCPQSKEIKIEGNTATIILPNKTMVDIVISADGYQTKILSIGTKSLESGTYSQNIKLDKMVYSIEMMMSFASGESPDSLESIAVKVDGFGENEFKKSIIENKIKLDFERFSDYTVSLSATGYRENKFELKMSAFTYGNLRLNVSLLKNDSSYAVVSVNNDLNGLGKKAAGHIVVSIADLSDSNLAELMLDVGENKLTFVKVDNVIISGQYLGGIRYIRKSKQELTTSPYLFINYSDILGLGGDVGQVAILINGVDYATADNKTAIVYDDKGQEVCRYTKENMEYKDVLVPVRVGKSIFVVDEISGQNYLVKVTSEMVDAGVIKLTSDDLDNRKKVKHKYIDSDGENYPLTITKNGTTILPDANGVYELDLLQSYTVLGVTGLPSRDYNDELSIREDKSGSISSRSTQIDMKNYGGDVSYITVYKSMEVYYRYVDGSGAEIQLLDSDAPANIDASIEGKNYYKTVIGEYDTLIGNYNFPRRNFAGVNTPSGRRAYEFNPIKGGLVSKFVQVIDGKKCVTLKTIETIGFKFNSTAVIDEAFQYMQIEVGGIDYSSLSYDYDNAASSNNLSIILNFTNIVLGEITFKLIYVTEEVGNRPPEEKSFTGSFVITKGHYNDIEDIVVVMKKD